MDAWFETWFELLFVFLMLGIPGPLVYWWKSRLVNRMDKTMREEVNLEIRPALRHFTMAWLSIFGSVLTWTILALFDIHPLGRPVSSVMPVIVGFHLVWWPFVPRIANRLNQLLEERGVVAPLRSKDRQRSASLSARRVGDYLPRRALPIAVTIAILGPLVIAASYVVRPVEEAVPAGFAAALFGIAGSLTIGLWFYCMRFSLSDRLPVGDTSNEDDREALRRQRIKTMYWIALVMAFAMYGSGLLTLEVSRGTIDDSTAGIIGGGVGGLVGCIGATIGIVGSVRAHRLRENRNPSASPTGE